MFLSNPQVGNYNSHTYSLFIVLDDDSIATPPPIPPYYSASFFNTIKKVKNETPFNVTTMSTSQWYIVLVEKEITMLEQDNCSIEYIKSRA